MTQTRMSLRSTIPKQYIISLDSFRVEQYVLTRILTISMSFAISKVRKVVFLAFCATLLNAPATSVAATTYEEQETELERVRTHIDALHGQLHEARERRDQIEAALRETELKVGNAVKQLQEVEANLTSRREQISRLHRLRGKQSGALAEQQQSLARQIRATYAMGRQDYFKMLLNQEDPSALSRALTYYGYFNQARAKRISDIRTQLSRIRKTETSIHTQTAELEQLRSEKEQIWQQLEAEKAKRSTLLAGLNTDIRDGSQTLARLNQDKAALEEVLRGLQRDQRDLVALDERTQSQQPFSEFRGQLNWPSDGELLHRFGTPRKPGNVRWQGVWIAAKEGQPVRAVSSGRVAFADWLRGFGLLLIIDHGHGYMSLYGHSQSLYKETGEWVEAGEIIASVGNSGGQAVSGLYFEIREDGIPKDPTIWCKTGVG